MKKEIEIVKEQYKTSDLLLASGIVSDTTEDYLRKGNLQVIPHPSHVFNEYYSNLYVYYEIYDITPDTDSLEITYTVVNKKDDKIIRKISRRIEKKFESQAVNFGLNIKAFDPGDYVFCVTVRDPDTEVVADKMIPFQIKKTVQKEVSYEGLFYYEEIKYFITPKDYKYFQSLPKEGKEIFLKKFWEYRNYFEIAERFEYADNTFREGNDAGRKTDRGRVYVKYGESDEIEVSTGEHYESRPYEYWQYYNGPQFIFVDIRGTSEYTLVWTNVTDEQSQPILYKYIPPYLRDLVR
jgi:GWxTD domain-containing protein